MYEKKFALDANTVHYSKIAEISLYFCYKRQLKFQRKKDCRISLVQSLFEHSN